MANRMAKLLVITRGNSNLMQTISHVWAQGASERTSWWVSGRVSGSLAQWKVISWMETVSTVCKRWEYWVNYKYKLVRVYWSNLRRLAMSQHFICRLWTDFCETWRIEELFSVFEFRFTLMTYSEYHWLSLLMTYHSLLMAFQDTLK